jgi:phosphoadenosine phosphosulfate reductase
MTDQLTAAPAFSAEQIADLNARFEDEYPGEILRWAAEQFADRLAIVTSFQPTGIVTLHMLQEVAPQQARHLPVLTLDTGLLFAETYTLTSHAQKLFNLNLVRVQPAQSVEEQASSHGPELWASNPDLCCNLRKTQPLDAAMRKGNYGAWITGLRRDQSAGRANVPIVAWDTKYNMLKLCPFATWTESMIWTYINAYELPYNPLHDQNYPSIGCWPCTQPAAEGDIRSGRWSGQGKTECGIHVQK